ncbi:MAG TPA: hypothetical protein VKE74_22025 [Gemmataceae bacterium]|nr:hypothetical protein [Gemmataceae bacterium]
MSDELTEAEARFLKHLRTRPAHAPAADFAARLREVIARGLAAGPSPGSPIPAPMRPDANAELNRLLAEWGVPAQGPVGYIDPAAVTDRLFYRLCMADPGAVPAEVIRVAAEVVRQWYVRRRESDRDAPRLPRDEPPEGFSTLQLAGSTDPTRTTMGILGAVLGYADSDWAQLKEVSPELYDVALLVFAGRTPDEIGSALHLPPDRVGNRLKALQPPATPA